MKPFNLQAALDGELVQLRDGHLAHIVYKHDDARDCYGHKLEHELIGYVLSKEGRIHKEAESWTLEGKVGMSTETDPWDIIGMYEKPTRLEILNEAWERGLQVRSLDTGVKYNVYAKTKDGDFVLASEFDGGLFRLKFNEFELVEE